MTGINNLWVGQRRANRVETVDWCQSALFYYREASKMLKKGSANS